VQGAAGGVGSAALQLGALAGLELYGTASGANMEFVAGLGATPIDYRREHVAARVRALTGRGVDVVLDGIGGTASLGSYRALRAGGRLIMFGHYATLVRGRKSLRSVLLFYATSGIPILAGLLPGGKRIGLYQCAKLKDQHPDWFRQDLALLFDLLLEGKIAPIVADRLPLAEARRAHELLNRGGVRGKVVLLCAE
jgi:NADPH2:quinone reductase